MLTTTTTIDPDTIAQLAVEGLALVRDLNGLIEESPAERHAIMDRCADQGEPFRRPFLDRDMARDLLESGDLKDDPAKQLRVAVAHEALSAMLNHYAPQAI